MQYVYVLSGWEGSAVDSRVLRDAVSRPNGLRVPNGNYYLCDCGYTNGPDFLTPYRGVRHHLDEFGTGTSTPQNYRSTMAVDPLEDEVLEYVVGQSHDQVDNEFVDVVEPSQIWIAWRDNLAQSMYNEWRR
ncbi:hypothetical protein DH2020_003511 [Rehmannia glutinosa]|uniref:DDE Tnp4 domain-containing protein n=1 Tax=Rehmannia glutinosa TaxID=99300 RepID=A0ABR0XM14_REHGL